MSTRLRQTRGEDGGAGVDEDFDSIMTCLGQGRWNTLYYIVVGYWHMCLSFHALAGPFISPPVGHTCLLPLHNGSSNASSIMTTDHYNSGSTAVDFQLHDPCYYLGKDTVNGSLVKMACSRWSFDDATFTSTLTSEFQLVCDRQYLRAFHQGLYMGGVFVGTFFNGFLADRFGRLRLTGISSVMYSIIAIGSAWLPSLNLILAARFLLGVMHPPLLLTGFILVMEVTEIKWRSSAGILVPSTWAIGTALWGFFAYLERDWRWLQTYVSLLCPLVLPLLLFLKESPRWLVVRGRHKEALEVVHAAAFTNRRELPPDDMLQELMKKVYNQSKAHQPCTSSFKQVTDQVTILFKSKRLALITVILCVGFFAGAMGFFGLTLSASAMHVDPFMFVAIAGLVELPAVAMVPVMERLGRKKAVISTFTLCAASLLLLPFVPERVMWLSITLVMVGKMTGTCAFYVMFVYASELYPTEIRSQGVGASLMSSRVGAFIAPFIVNSLESRYPWAISVVFGLIAAMAAVCIIPLTETRNTGLPDTVTQIEPPQTD